MMDDGKLTEIIKLAISAPLFEDHWSDIVDRVAHYLGGHFSTYYFDVTGQRKGTIWLSSGYDACTELIDDFFAGRYPDEIEIHRTLNGSEAHIVIDELMLHAVDRDELVPSTPFRQQLHDRLGVQSRVGTKLNDVGPWVDMTALHLSGSNSSIPKSTRDFLQFISPIFGKSIEMQRILSKLTSKNEALLNLFDSLSFGAAFLDTRGRIMLANMTLKHMAKDGDAFRIDGSNKFVEATVGSSQLTNIVKSAQNHLSHESEALALLQRKSGDAPLIAKAAKVFHPEVAGEDLVLIIVLDPKDDAPGDISMIAALGNLTNAEKEICRLLIEGFDTKAIANQRNTSVATTRTQLKAAQAKLGCHSKLDLLRLALATTSRISGKHTPRGV